MNIEVNVELKLKKRISIKINYDFVDIVFFVDMI